MNNQRGFTLIELLLWLVALGIVAAIVVPSYHQMTDRWKDEQIKDNMATFRRTVEDYCLDRGRLPVTDSVAVIARMLPQEMLNPCTKQPVDFNQPGPGAVCYSSDGLIYTIKGYDHRGMLMPVVLSQAE